MKKINPSLPKGTRDFGPEEMKKRNYVFNIFRKTFSLFGFNSIETPSLENIEILNGKYGDEGKPIVEINPDHEISKIYLDLAKKIHSIYF